MTTLAVNGPVIGAATPMGGGADRSAATLAATAQHVLIKTSGDN